MQGVIYNRHGDIGLFAYFGNEGEGDESLINAFRDGGRIKMKNLPPMYKEYCLGHLVDDRDPLTRATPEDIINVRVQRKAYKVGY